MVPIQLRRTLTGAVRAGLDSPLPDPVSVGNGTAIVVTGWCYHEWLSIRGLQIQCGDSIVPAVLSGIPRTDLDNTAGNAGFAAVLPIAAVAEPAIQPIIIHAALAGGRTESISVGNLRLLPSHNGSPVDLAPQRLGTISRPYGSGETAGPPASIAVCLVTSDPATDFFARQIAALRGQTELSWTCLVNDDGSKPESSAAIRGMLGDDRRFQFVRQPTKLGPYRSIENCLHQVPSNVEFVALLGAHEIWQRDALAVLRSRFKARTSLLAAWPGPMNLSELVISDLPLGSVMFRRSVLSRILPFPRGEAHLCAGSWIASAAATAGDIANITEPICEPTATTVPADNDPPPKSSFIARVRGWLDDGCRQFVQHGLRIQQLTTALQIRNGGRLSWAQCRALGRVSDPLWLVTRAVRQRFSRPSPPDHASALLQAQIWSATVRAQRIIGLGRQRLSQPATARRHAA
jgi:glycosyl transferase family 2